MKKNVCVAMGLILSIVLFGGCGRSSITGSGGGSSGSGSGGTTDPWSDFVDEFLGSTISAITGMPAPYSYESEQTPVAFSMNGLTAGSLVVEPESDGDSAYYGNSFGSFVYKSVDASEDFVVWTRLTVGHVTGPGTYDYGNFPDGAIFQTGGLLLRNSAGTHSGNENWVLMDLGSQETATTYRMVSKTTTNSTTHRHGTAAVAVNQGILAVCKIGTRYYMFYKLDGSPGYTAWPSAAPTYNPDVAPAAAEYYDRPTLADGSNEIQVGLVIGAWGASQDVVVRFNYLRFASHTGTIADRSGCTAAITD